MRLEVLGPLRLLIGDADRTPGSATQRRLLAALAVRHGRVVSTDRLCADLWGDELPSTALASLRTYVYRLRSHLAADGERPRGQLALAQYRSGRHSDALAECRRFVRTMRDELGLDPPERIARLEQQILRQAPDLQPAVTAGSPPAAQPAAAPDLPPEPSVLLGRDDDLARLRRRLSSDRVVSLTGVGEVGKTRLALRAAHAAAAGGEVVVWCELAALEDGSEVGPAVAAAAGIQVGTTGPQRSQRHSRPAGCCWCSTTPSTSSPALRSSSAS